MRKLIPFFVFVILSFLASCGKGTQDQMVDVSATSTPIPSTATETFTNTPLATLMPIESPIPTPPSIATSYNVPKWLGNLDYTVIMAITSVTENSNQLTFFNANTRERYDISLPIKNLSHYFWTTDGKSLGFLSRDKTTVFVVSSNTGITSEYSLTKEASACLQKYFDSRGAPENKFILSDMQVYDTTPESDTFFCEPPPDMNFPNVKESSGFSAPIAWSKDDSLYIAQSSLSENYGLPCVLDLEGNVLKCLSTIDEKYYVSGLDLFRWSNDVDQIYYVQTDSLTRTDLCIYNLKTDEVNCPSENIAELSNNNIEYYVMSDDEQFFIVLYGSSCSGCDFWGEPSSVVFRRDGTNILFLGTELQEPNTLWPYPFFTSSIRPSQ